ncbi:MAG: hypothetical protein DRO88_13365 [Promethearchaeia archaeon]|nr:MAG: hypothetical protein DRO88_13365 [Candidatus Lokiarchaeia archaeon]
MTANLAKLKQELYIMDKGGQMLFYYSNIQGNSLDDEQNKLLTASYLTGVLQFAKAASGNLISSFEMGKSNIFLKKGNRIELFYVYIADKKVKLNEKKADKTLSVIVEEFEKCYTPDDIASWDGDLDACIDFTPIVKKFIK